MEVANADNVRLVPRPATTTGFVRYSVLLDPTDLKNAKRLAVERDMHAADLIRLWIHEAAEAGMAQLRKDESGSK